MNFFRKIGPILLLPLMFISSFGFSLDMHYCGGEIKSIGLFGAEACEMEDMQMNQTDDSNLPPCHRKNKIDTQKKCSSSSSSKEGFNTSPCCHNESVNFEGNSTITQAANTIPDLQNVQAVLAYVIVLNQAIHFDFHSFDYQNYKPPLLVEDFSTLQQVFII